MKTWSIENKNVKTGVTEIGGFLDPVTFKFGNVEFSPLNKAPWIDDKNLENSIPPMLKLLRNDFFCAPFGDSDILSEENRAHGSTANDKWRAINITPKKIELQLCANIMEADVRKIISIEDEHSVIYEEHIFKGGGGKIPIGHHLMLKADSPLKLSFSNFILGATPPSPIETAPELGQSFLQYPQKFSSLNNVKLSNGNTMDLSEYPKMEKHEDLLMMISDDSLPFAWSAAVNSKSRWVFFALKSPNILRSTVLWFSNGGRFYPPFSGRHKNVIGIEEVTGFFHLGHKASVNNNFLNQSGFPTSISLTPNKDFHVRYLFGLVPFSKDFGRVKRIEKYSDGINIIDENENKLHTKVDINFIEDNLKENK